MKSTIPRLGSLTRLLAGLSLLFSLETAQAQPSASPAIKALPSLDVAAYMGTWYQVAWYPNRFQKQCVSDTAATYRLLEQGHVEVVNRCRREDGSVESVIGLARPAQSVLAGGRLEPAQLEVSFLPALLRWLPVWGNYWVLDLGPEGRYAVVGEPQRDYLWVLARQPALSPADESAIRSKLLQLGYDLERLRKHTHMHMHIHTPSARPAASSP